MTLVSGSHLLTRNHFDGKCSIHVLRNSSLKVSVHVGCAWSTTCFALDLSLCKIKERKENTVLDRKNGEVKDKGDRMGLGGRENSKRVDNEGREKREWRRRRD